MIAIMRDGMGVGLAATQLGMLRRLLVFQAGPRRRADGAGQPRDRVALRGGRRRRGGLPQPAAGLDGRRAPAARTGQRPRRRGRAGRDRGLGPRGAGAPARDRPPRRHPDPRPHRREQRKGALRALREGGSYSPPVEDEDEDGRRAPRAANRRVSRPSTSAPRSSPPTVLRRLAGSPHRPALVVTPPDRPRGRGRRTLPPPAAEAARRAGDRAAPGRERQRRGGAGADPRGAAARRSAVCAFGQLIREPLLSELADAERPSLAAAALARRGADRAGDHGRRRAHRRLRHAGHRRPRLRAGGPPRGGRDRPRRGLRVALGEARRARRRAAGRRRSTCGPRGGSSSRSRTRRRRPTPRRSTPPSAASTPPARPIELARAVRALTPARRRLPGDRADGERLGVRRARAVDVGVKTGEVRAEWGALLLGCGGRGALRLEVVQPPGGKPMPVDAYLRGHPLPKLRDLSRAGARLRRCSERPSRRAPSPSGPSARRPTSAASAAASAPRRSASPTAPCSAAAPPTRRSSASPSARRGCSTRRCWPALRLGLYELLFADATPDHAAVDQAVELVKRAGAAHAAGLVNAVLRRAARERAELTASLLGDDSTPEAAAVAHSAPLWLARMWWEELGADAARSLLAACNEPAEIAFRATRAIARRCLRELRDAGSRGAGTRGRVAAGRAGDDRHRGPDRRGRPGAGRGREADAAEPRLRRRGRGARPAARASTSSTSAPGRGSRPARSRRGWATAAR